MSAKILLIDDDVRFRELVAAPLRARGHQVVEAGSGDGGTAAHEAEHPDLVIVDGLLPDTDGLRWIALLRSRGFSTPVIFLSSLWRDPLSHRRLVEELRVTHVVHKPIAPTDFSQLVDAELRRVAAAPAVPEKPADLNFEASLDALREAYRSELPGRLAELAAILDELQRDPRNVEKLRHARELAHKLRGTAGSYGFILVGEESGRIEDILLGAIEEERIGVQAWRLASQALKMAELGVEAVPHSVRAAPYNALGRILVVDDDLGFLSFVREMGRSLLVDVVGVPTAAEALQAVQEGHIDAAIIDAHLAADEDAFELGRSLRAIPGRESLPFAIVSVDVGVENRVAAAHSGASLFLSKPLESQRFEVSVRQLLAQRRRDLPRVLIVDDDKDFSRQVAQLLEGDDIMVQTLENVPAMIEILAQQPPDLLLLDMEMPGMSGLDACRLVRMTPDWQEIPVLFVTAHTGMESRIAAFEAGADDYLAKPVVPQEIRTRIRLRLERNRLLRERSDRDALTGLLTRRALFEALPARCAEARRHGRPLSVALLDLDHFKQVNDEHGHLVGDRVLMRLGRLLAARFRVEDLRGRWGGEEFLVAFPGESPKTVKGVLERVLAEFAQVPFYNDRGEAFACSFSVGVAGAPADGSTPDGLLHVADRRLYAAKSAGRAQVVSDG